MFTLDNINLHYPHALVERVPVGKLALWFLHTHLICIVWNVVYAGVIPFIFLSIWLAVAGSSSHKVQVTLLGLLIAYDL
jgi:diacylglycerol diphosphate phosphatase / phosphatidate phosphatase